MDFDEFLGQAVGVGLQRAVDRPMAGTVELLVFGVFGQFLNCLTCEVPRGSLTVP